LINKKLIKKIRREKQTIIKIIKIKTNIKIKLNQVLWNKIEKKKNQTKYIVIKKLKIKFSIINK
jgi:hypothetical protein